MVAVRRAAWRDPDGPGWHEDLVWYAAAVHQMRLRTPGLDDFLDLLTEALATGFPDAAVDAMTDIAAGWDDPRGLGYHAQVHGTFVPVERWPVVGGGRAPWLECAHNHWFFLPWHRAFLLELEAVARGHVADLGGPAQEWGLPYWDYTDHVHDGRRLGLPLPLRGETLPPDVDVPGVEPRGDGSTPNPLHVPGRALTGDPATADPSWADATRALHRPHFANQQDSARVSFGGGVLEDATNHALFHDRTREHGQVDVQPHGSVHGQVHGAMALFQTAGLDPVFCMHHANVDRLWETYARDLGHGYPFVDGAGVGTAAHASWVARRFVFVDGSGSPRSWTAPELLDVEALGYRYDSTAPPPMPPAPPDPPGSEVAPFGLDEVLPEPVAATPAFTLTGPTTVRAAGGAAADLSVAAYPAEARWVLRFEGVRGARPAPTSFHVYLGLPQDAAADPADEDHHVGLLSLFGVWEATRPDGASSGAGQRRTLDATAQVRAQGATLRPGDVAVRLEPVDPDRDVGGAGLTVERLTLEVG